MVRKKNNDENFSLKELPLNRKAVAAWLINNTSLTFEQIGNFCGMDELEVSVMADGEINTNIVPVNPLITKQLTEENIKECENDSSKDLVLVKREEVLFETKKTKYIPIARRSDKPDAIFFLLKYYPDITDKDINKLTGAAKTLIENIKNKNHWRIKEIVPKDPVLLGLCSKSLFDEIIAKYKNNNAPASV
ncbi:MAG: DUF1013 domain-containing protein [Rickettsiales bacterium]|jgi:hypothetical protein|nr:DUF1013 domain-containing protein [Rickettsiales bacterium]